MEKIRIHQNFASFSPEELDKLIAACVEKKVIKNEILFKEGEIGEILYIVADGNIKISKLGHLGEIVIAYINPGEIVGEMAIIDRSMRSATAIAVTDSVLFGLNNGALENLKKENPNVAIKFLEILLKILSERLRQTTRKILKK
jgi:CRP-like cAMP-binding protein